MLLAVEFTTEIQQASDVTYRVYDYDRIDAKKGKPRRLHQNEAVDAIDFSGDALIDYKEVKIAPFLVESDYFSTHLMHESKITLVKAFLRMRLVSSLALKVT